MYFFFQHPFTTKERKLQSSYTCPNICITVVGTETASYTSISCSSLSLAMLSDIFYFKYLSWGDALSTNLSLAFIYFYKINAVNLLL